MYDKSIEYLKKKKSLVVFEHILSNQFKLEQKSGTFNKNGNVV